MFSQHVLFITIDAASRLDWLPTTVATQL